MSSATQRCKLARSQAALDSGPTNRRRQSGNISAGRAKQVCPTYNCPAASRSDSEIASGCEINERGQAPSSSSLPLRFAHEALEVRLLVRLRLEETAYSSGSLASGVCWSPASKSHRAKGVLSGAKEWARPSRSGRWSTRKIARSRMIFIECPKSPLDSTMPRWPGRGNFFANAA